jgi:N-methylhydantoinase A/oxoprolinase/acetone carboxylase beta subunit/DUF917 family protein
MNYKIAIDVGGTHTDAVLILIDQNAEQETIVDALKIPTHGNDVTSSVLAVMEQLLDKNDLKAEDIARIQLGTTHFVNALKQRQHLEKVAAIRLALPASDFVPPFASWPREAENPTQRALYDELFGYTAIIHGGNAFDGKVSARLSRQEIQHIAKDIQARGLKKVMLSAPFSEKFPEIENLAQRELARLLPADVDIQLSQDIGRGNILQRENAAILNLSLRNISSEIFTDLQRRLHAANYRARLLITRNDGSSMTVEEAIEKPFLAYSSGQINSIRGAGMLSEVKDGVVVDIGGTTTDVGLLNNGVPHMVNLNSKEEGIDLMLTCAHQSSIALGGGSVIHFDDGGEVQVSEQSVGHALEREAFFAGGSTFTVTDLAIAQGRLTLEQVDMPAFHERLEQANISQQQLLKADELVHQKVASAIDSILIDSQALPILLVGGGAPLIDSDFLREQLMMDYLDISLPEKAEVANAVGASAGKVMTLHTVECLDSDDSAKESARKAAMEKAIAQGAKPESIVCVSEYAREISYCEGLVNYTVVVEGDFGYQDLEVSFDSYFQQAPYQRSIITGDATSPAATDSEGDDASLHYLTTKEVEQMAIGTGYLGSGGGGDAAIGETALCSAIRSGFKVPLVDLGDLNDNDYVIMVGYGGMPSVINERLLSSLSGPAAMERLQTMITEKLSRETGREQTVNIAAAIPIEVGGANGLLSALQASAWGIPIADADAMGRAFPMIHMNTVDIYGQFEEQMIVLANDQGKTTSITGTSLASCSEKIGAAILENGGAVFTALMPMRVAEAKRYCLLNTVSDAIKIGKTVQEGLQRKAPFQAVLSKALDGTSYHGCENVFSGTIIEYSPKSDGRHNSGRITIRNPQGDRCQIYFKNECLMARVNDKTVALSPDIISLVNPDAGIAIGSTADYHVGLRVNVIKIDVPEQLKTPQALLILRDQLLEDLIDKFGLEEISDDHIQQAASTSDDRRPVRAYSQTGFGGNSTLYQPRANADGQAALNTQADQNDVQDVSSVLTNTSS